MIGRLLFILSLAAGCVDAAGFLASGVFPANMTGNSVILALGLAHASVAGPGIAGAVLALFSAGVIFAAFLLRQPPDGWNARTRAVLLTAAGILLLSAAARFFVPFPSALATAFAMGLQACAVAQIAMPGVSTVVVTNTLTTLFRRLVAGNRAIWLPAGSWLGYFLGAVVGALLERLLPALPLALSGLLILAFALVTNSSKQAAGQSGGADLLP